MPILAFAQGIRLDDYPDPFPESNYTFVSQAQSLEMTYMDVTPDREPLATVVLLHGKNFSGAYFAETEFNGLGHLPHIEAFDRFFPPYLAFLHSQ